MVRAIINGGSPGKHARVLTVFFSPFAKVQRFSQCVLTLIIMICSLDAHADLDWRLECEHEDVCDNVEKFLSDLGNLAGKSEQAVQRFVREAVASGARGLGYYQASHTLRDTNDGLLITVDAGEPVKWGEASLGMVGAGQHDATLSAFLVSRPFIQNAPMSHDRYEDFKKRWLAEAKKLGYFDARFAEHRLEVDPQRNLATARLTLDTGKQYFVGDVRFKGSQVDSDVLAKVVPFETGEAYNTQLLTRLYSQLLATDYFDEIAILPVKGAPPYINLDVTLQDAEPHRFTTGLGVSSDTGPRVRLGWDRKIIGSKGHQIHSDARASRIEQRLSAEYRIPVRNPVKNYLSLNTGWTNKDSEDTEYELLEASVSYHSLRDNQWHHSYHLSVEREIYEQGSEEEGKVFYVLPGANWSLTQIKGKAILPDAGL